MKKIRLILLVLLIIVPLKVYGSTSFEEYDSAKINFTIDNEWEKKEFNSPKNFLDKKWESDCGMITSGISDLLLSIDINELDGYERADFNYINLFNDNSFAERIIDEQRQMYNVDSWEFREYYVKFIYFTGSVIKDGIRIDYENYITVNNGYVVIFQFMHNDSLYKNTCNTTLTDIVSTVKDYSGYKKHSNEIVSSFNYVSLLLNLLLTIVLYLGYPFVNVVLMKKKYTKEECNKMALWNSIIIGLLCLLITTILKSNVAWNVVPAFVYYLINKNLWVSKKNKNSNKNNDKKDLLCCDKCGTIVNKDDKECPNCGENFDEEIENSNDKIVKDYKNSKNDKEDKEDCVTDMDKKYNDLTKLKRLLDNDIITKGEFENEKKKILNSK